MKLQHICLAAGLALTPLALADELHVPSQYPTIEAAIAASQAGDEVVLADGVYVDQYVWMPSHTLTLRSASGDPALCIVQAREEAGSRVIGPSSGSTIRGITFRGGSGEYQGGAMYTGSSARFERCIFTGNHTSGWWDGSPTGQGEGGAIYLSGSNATFEECVFSSNSARISPVLGMGSGAGGAIYIDGGSPIFLDCEFRSNHASGNDFGGGSGGALRITNGADVRILGGAFVGNGARGDGGAGSGAIGIGNNASVHIDGVRFERNAASSAQIASGGAIGGSGRIDIVDCLFVQNEAKADTPGWAWFAAGGALSLGGQGQVSMTNVVMAGNRVTAAISCSPSSFEGGFGGAMSISGAISVTIRGGTFWNNSADCRGGAIYRDGVSGALDVANTVIYINGTDPISNYGDPSISITYSNIEGGWPGVGNIDADPMLVNPAAGDWRPGPGSPVIDAGDNTAMPTGILTDLAGLPRFVDDPATPDTGVPGGAGGSAIVDMGAYEYQADFCYADCDGSGELDFADFLCFQNAFAAADPYADCDGNGTFDFFDFLCYQNAFAAGCP